MREERLPVVVIGAGAAGFMAAIFAARGGRVLLLERTRDGGRKILMSGGGRCNVLPSAIDPRRFVTASSPHTLKKLLLSWPLPEQRRFFEERLGIALALEEETGKLFPVSNRSRTSATASPTWLDNRESRSGSTRWSWVSRRRVAPGR